MTRRLECLKEELLQLTDEADRIGRCLGAKWIPEEIKERIKRIRIDIKSMELEEERINKMRHLGETILREAGLEEREHGWVLSDVEDSDDEILAVTCDTSCSGCVLRLYCTYVHLDECHNWHKKEMFIISSDWMLNTDSTIDILRAINADAPDGQKYFRLAQFNATVERIKLVLNGKSIPERGNHNEKSQ